VEKYQKPVALFVFTESAEMDYLRRHSDIPIFSAPENAMRAFYLSHKWSSRRPLPFGMSDAIELNKGEIESLISNAGPDGMLSLRDSTELVKSCGFKMPEYLLARTSEDALEAWHALKGPVAMKINHPHVIHKSDVGAVRLDLNSPQEVVDAFNALKAVVADEIQVLIQSMAESGLETILGGRQDVAFGPVVLFGLGGIFVEAMEDVIWRLAPVTKEEARRMVNQIKGRKILSGMRGERPYDTNALEDLLVRLSQLLATFPSIQEIDINPVIVHTDGRGAQAVDARVVIAEVDDRET
jgi:acyl-CoA synthetase (NDP forming)